MATSNEYKNDALMAMRVKLAIDNIYSIIFALNITNKSYMVERSVFPLFMAEGETGTSLALKEKMSRALPKEDLMNYPILSNLSDLVQHLLNNKGAYSFEFRLEVEPSDYHWFRGSCFLLDDEGLGINTGEQEILFMFQDINYEKTIQESLKEAFVATEIATRAKTEFLTKMSQDIKSPINLIISLIEIAKEKPDDRDFIMDCLDKMDVSSKYLSQVISNAIDMAQVENGNFSVDYSPFNIVSAIEEVMGNHSSAAKAKNILYEFLHSDNVPTDLMGDPYRVKQILKHLISNSLKYVPESGVITVQLNLNKIQFDRAFYSIRVENSGPCFAEGETDRLFRPFEKGKVVNHKAIEDKANSGLGLGLAICKNITELLGGSISAGNKPDKSGVYFEVQLPFEIAEPEEEDEVNGNLYDDIFSGFSGKKLLIATESDSDFHQIAELLKDKNIYVEQAINGFEAVNAYETSEIGEYALILMDLNLSIMSGIDAALAIRNSFREDAISIPIIAMIEPSQLSDLVDVLGVGINDHIPKPITGRALYMAIKNFL